MSELIIKYDEVTLGYNKIPVLKNINFAVNKADAVFITGKVASGKTTLLKSIYAEVKPLYGTATVLNFNIKKLPLWKIHLLRRRIGYIFQDFQFIQSKTVWQNLEFVLQAVGWTDKNKINKRIETVLNDMELLDKKNKYPFELSGGQKQCLSIARALINNPEIILADEPTNNLDYDTAQYIIDKIYQQKNKNITLIVVSHDLTIIDKFDFKMFIIENNTLLKI